MDLYQAGRFAHISTKQEADHVKVYAKFFEKKVDNPKSDSENLKVECGGVS
jgi:hypothetical protein